MKKEELEEILKLHKLWILGKKNGKRANLRNANLRNTDLRNTDLRNTDLWGADLWGADLWGTDLWGADLRNANLRNVNLRNTDLRNTDLWGADLWGADLRNANLWGADLRNTDLWGAKLKQNIKIKSKKFSSYIGSDYYCLFFGSIIKIGCEVYYRSDWGKFNNKDILKMDGEPALKFWKKEKKIILSISKHLTG